MKNKKLKIAVVAMVLCILAATGVGTVAWFTASDTVENTLKFVTDFEMDLYETDGKGNIIQDTVGNSIGQTYQNLTPGEMIYKDPTVINKSSTEAQYIRVKVTVDHADIWKTVVGEGSDLAEIFTGFDSTLWTRTEAPVYDSTAKTLTYTFYLKDTLQSGKTATLFTGVTVPGALTSAQAVEMGSTTVTVTADALQTSDLGEVTTAEEAYKMVEGN